jgi:hypothetical protein
MRSTPQNALSLGALSDGSEMGFVDEAERAGEEMDVGGTPAWESHGSVISGLQEAAVWKNAEKDMKRA